MRRTSTVLILLLVLQAAPPAWAWGRLGHRVVAKFAECHLNASARAGIAELLEPGESLADCSTWPDEHRWQMGAGRPHGITPTSPSTCRAMRRKRTRSMGRSCPGSVSSGSSSRTARRPVEERRQALRFLVHLVGDLHQPLHVGDDHDRGGNSLQVRFFARGTNLHHLWDSLLLERWSRDEDIWVAELATIDNPSDRASAMRGTVEDWATESLGAARQAHLDPRWGGGSGPEPCSERRIARRTYPWRGSGSTRPEHAWRGCSMR